MPLKTSKSRKCPEKSRKIPYAHIEVLVTFLLVNFVGFLVITRDHGSFEGRHQVEILPTDLPELFKPSRDLKNLRKTKILDENFYLKKNGAVWCGAVRGTSR